MAPPTRTRRPTVRTRTGRTGRASAPAQGRFARGAATSHTQGLRRRRQPEPTGIKKVISGVPAAGAKAMPGSKKGKAGGLALLAAAAGVAVKNRDKLSRLRGGKGTSTIDSSPPTV